MKINVLHVHTLPVVSGTGISMFLCMHGFDKKRYDVELACAPGGRLINLALDHKMKVRLIRNLVQPLRPLRDIFALIELVVLLKRNPYHVVHTHNSKAGFIGRLAAKLARVPCVVHTVHGFAFHNQEPLWRQLLYKNLERIASHWCDIMIFISQPLIDWALSEKIVGRKKIVKIYNGLELKKFKPTVRTVSDQVREKWGLNADDAVVGIVSKLWEGKGHKTLIEAIAILKICLRNVKLLIVGEGYLEKELRHLVSNLKLTDSVVFTGFCTDVPSLISAFDVAVLPSFFEGMGRVLLEAMAMEKPVVASNVGGIPDIVDDGINGFLVTPGNVEELTVAIEKLLQNKDLAVQMGKAGREHLGREFSADFMVQSIEKVYRELLGEKRIECDR